MPKAVVMDKDALPLVLTAQHVQQIAGVSKDTSYALLHQRGFPTVRIGKSLRVPRDAFFAWLAKEASQGDGETCD